MRGVFENIFVFVPHEYNDDDDEKKNGKVNKGDDIDTNFESL